MTDLTPNSQGGSVESGHDPDEEGSGSRAQPWGLHRSHRGFDEPSEDAPRDREPRSGGGSLEQRRPSDELSPTGSGYSPEDDPSALTLPVSIVNVEASRESRHHSGLLPSPRQLQDYDSRFPGLADHIVGWTDQQLNMAQRAIDADALATEKLSSAEAFAVRAGTWSTILATPCFIVAAVALSLTGRSSEAMWLAAGAALSALPKMIAAARGPGRGSE